MNKATYAIVPKHLASTEDLCKMVATMGQDELDINLTLLGASKLSSKELSEAIKSKTFEPGFHIMVKWSKHVVPFKAFDYTEDGCAFCQSMMSLYDPRFDDHELLDYSTSATRHILSTSVFSKDFTADFLHNHVAEGNWEVEVLGSPDKLDYLKDKFSLMSLRELFMYCRTSKSRMRYGLDGKPVTWNVRDNQNALEHQANFINMSDMLFYDLKSGHPDMPLTVGIVPVCMIH